ncbi:MAG: hypothetical protein ACJAZH_000088 [Roseivirga sp.]|jgi:hypothetical protein
MGLKVRLKMRLKKYFMAEICFKGKNNFDGT